MSVIIRLDNLPWNASSLDIRQYFYGLDIPDGGVHIVGGERGTAFIVFATDEDARQALMKDKGQISNETVKLFLSSRTEMQNIIASNRGTSVPVHEVFTNPSFVKRGTLNSSPPSSAARPSAQSFGQKPPQSFGQKPPQSFGQKPPQSFGQKPRGFSNTDDDLNDRSSKIRRHSPTRPGNQSADTQTSFPERHQSDQTSPLAEGRYAKGQRNPVPQGNRNFPIPEKRFGNEAEFQTFPQKRSRFEEPQREREVFVKPRNFHEEGKRFDSFVHQPEEHGPDRHQFNDFERSHDHNFERNRSGGDGNWVQHNREDRGVHNAKIPGSTHDGFNGRNSAKPYQFPGQMSHESEQRLQESQSYTDQRAFEKKSGNQDGDWVVQVSNLPLDFHYKKIRKLFSNSMIPVNGVTMINDQKGRRTGICYIRFASEKGFLEALKCDGNMVYGNAITVRKADARELESGVESSVLSHAKGKRSRSRSPLAKEFGGEFFGIIIRNFPPGCDVHALIKWLRIPQPEPGDGPIFDYDDAGYRLCKAYIRLPSNIVMDVVDFCNGKFWKRHKVQVFPIRMKFFTERGTNFRWWTELEPEEMDEEPNSRTGFEHSPAFGNASEKKFHCVRIDGLPFSATPQAIKEFFKGLEIANGGIHIVYNQENKASGLGFVEFVTSTDCHRAAERSNQYMGKRYLIITPVDRDDFLAEFNEVQQQAESFQESRVDYDEDSTYPVQDFGGEETIVRLENLHFKVELDNILQFFGGHQPIVESIKLQYRDGKPTGNGLITFPSVVEADRAVRELNHKRLLGWPVTLSMM